MALWKAESVGDLPEISGVIHDAYFDADAVRYDAAARTVCIPFAQEWDSPPLDADPAWQAVPQPVFVRKAWRYTEERVAFMRGVLRVADVNAFSADAGAGDAGTLLGIAYDSLSGRLTIEGVSGDLAALIGRIDVTAELHPGEVGVFVLRRRGLFGSSERPLWGWSPST